MVMVMVMHMACQEEKKSIYVASKKKKGGHMYAMQYREYRVSIR